ncbi:MAG TPA: DUF3465 domain-containing protein [Pyrinomonadaceae bacterium]|nr:DUF3465 domain-containing protein [Pyrinomonadaceae bacterium]
MLFTYPSHFRVVILLLLVLSGCSVSPTQGDAIARAFEQRQSDVQVEGEVKVLRILPDDKIGSPHQRFIVQLSSGQTILIQHNIDIAPRIDALKVGDTISFSGEYVWNDKGGLIHWTHHDPAGKHHDGWIKLEGRIFQ